MRWYGVVVAFDRCQAGSVGADHRDSYGFLQRKDAIVLEKHHGFFRSLQSQFPMCGRVVLGKRNLRILHLCRIIEQSKLKACREKTIDRTVNFFFGDQSILNRLSQHLIFLAATRIGSRTDSGYGRMFEIG